MKNSNFRKIVTDSSKSIDYEIFKNKYSYKNIPVLFKNSFAKSNTLDIFKCWYKEQNNVNEDTRKINEPNSFSSLKINKYRFGSWFLLEKGVKEWFVFPHNFTKAMGDLYSDNNEFSIDEIDNLILKPLHIKQYPGELLFIPGECYYLEYNNTESSEFSSDFLNESTYNYAKIFLSKNRKIENSKLIQNSFDYGFNEKSINKKYNIKIEI